MHIVSTTRAAALSIVIAVTCAVIAGCSSAEDRQNGSSSHTTRWSVPSDEAITALLAERMTNNGVGMVVTVIDRGRRSIVVHGESGAEAGRPLDGDTVFQLGSLTKVVTGLLLAEMVVRGEVSLDDPVQQLLPPGVVLEVVERPMTLRDLATHTSGLPSMPTNFDIRGEPDPYAAYSVDQLWTFLSTFRPGRAPGTAYQYSNLGVSLLGRVLALKAGTTYEALVKERVLTPLGMTSTSITLSSEQNARVAPGHDPYLNPIRPWEMTTLQASGSLRSTGNDMLRLLAVYLATSDLPHLTKAAAVQMREGVSLNGAFYPLCLGLRPDGTYRHAGGKEGYRSGLAFNPGTGAGAIVLANARTYDSEPMAVAAHLVTGETLSPASPAPPAKPRVVTSNAELERFSGRYRSEAGQEWEVVVVGELLRIRYPNNSIFEFVSSGPLDFFYNAGNDDITFTSDNDGRVVGMTIFGDGRSEGNGQYASRVTR
jgi:CubicO group peptidase (beta-lactamase class C family)